MSLPIIYVQKKTVQDIKKIIFKSWLINIGKLFYWNIKTNIDKTIQITSE